MRSPVWNRCNGDAHSNAFIDHCAVCMPYWSVYPTCPDCGRKLRETRQGFDKDGRLIVGRPRKFYCRTCRKFFSGQEPKAGEVKDAKPGGTVNPAPTGLTAECVSAGTDWPTKAESEAIERTYATLQDEQDERPALCPQCESADAAVLGVLGKTVWLRCRACGWDFRKRGDA